MTSYAKKLEYYILVFIFLMVIPNIIFFCAYPPLPNQKVTLLQNRVAELQSKLASLNSTYLNSQIKLLLLTTKIKYGTQNSIDSMKHFNSKTSIIKFPTIYDILPHLLNDKNSLRPAYIHSRGRSDVSMVLGILNVKNKSQNYLVATLRELVDGIRFSEAAETLIVIFIAETDSQYVEYMAKQIRKQFSGELDSGLIDIISPRPSYYPDFVRLQNTSEDHHQQVAQKSKRNLDFAFLMSYAQTRGTFYVQLGDDILAEKNFIATMKSFALQKIGRKENWIVLDFCQLEFVGKLFKCVDLPWLVQFFFMFYNDESVDSLFDHFLTTKFCNLDKDEEHCKQVKSKMWVRYMPCLFQQIGSQSLLDFKIKLND